MGEIDSAEFGVFSEYFGNFPVETVDCVSWFWRIDRDNWGMMDIWNFDEF